VSLFDELQLAQNAAKIAIQRAQETENALVEQMAKEGKAAAWGVIFLLRKKGVGVSAPFVTPRERQPTLFPLSTQYWYHVRGISLLVRSDQKKVFAQWVESEWRSPPYRVYRQDWHEIPVRENDRPLSSYPQFPFYDRTAMLCSYAIAFFQVAVQAKSFLALIQDVPAPFAGAAEEPEGDD